MVQKFMVEKSRVGKFMVEKSGVEKFMVEKSGVEKFMVEKSGVERSRVKAWDLKSRVEMSFNLLDSIGIYYRIEINYLLANFMLIRGCL
jgi:hypothetical protein